MEIWLLEFYKDNSLFIVNGRVGKDKNIGRFTCRNASVVDYCISSPYFFLNLHSKILTFLILVNYIQMFTRLLRYVFLLIKFHKITKMIM